MTTVENKEIVLRHNEALARGDINEWLNAWAPDVRDHGRPWVIEERPSKLFHGVPGHNTE